ncbi:MAG: hypothetical protein LAQ69_03510 [Acidobacteriia bacterium]|nr:hypothetical protein [Terriglobia bacterium]
MTLVGACLVPSTFDRPPLSVRVPEVTDPHASSTNDDAAIAEQYPRSSDESDYGHSSEGLVWASIVVLLAISCFAFLMLWDKVGAV